MIGVLFSSNFKTSYCTAWHVTERSVLVRKVMDIRKHYIYNEYYILEENESLKIKLREEIEMAGRKSDERMLGMTFKRTLLRELRALAFFRDTTQSEIVRGLVEREIEMSKASGEFISRPTQTTEVSA